MSGPNVYVTIGNSDNKLTQVEWSRFCTAVEFVVSKYAVINDEYGLQLFGPWHTLGNSGFQSMCIGFVSEAKSLVKGELRKLCKEYRQDWIAWVEGPVIELKPEGVAG